MRAGRHVEGGIAGEETHGDQREPGVLDGHDGPVLGSGDVGGPERVPDDDVPVDDGPVLRRPARQSSPPLCWLG